MRALLGVVRTRSGARFVIDGRETGSWTRRDLAQAVGAVPQAEHLAFPITVRDFVAMGRYPHLGPFRPEGEADREAILEAMVRCDVEELGNRDVTDPVRRGTSAGPDRPGPRSGALRVWSWTSPRPAWISDTR